MSSTVSHAFRVQSRRDQMVLTTVKDSAKVKAKARGGYRRKARQLCYRDERHQRFQGPRDEALEEEVRASARDRRERSIQVMARWLHEQANAEEECPRPVEGERASGESSMVARESRGFIWAKQAPPLGQPLWHPLRRGCPQSRPFWFEARVASRRIVFKSKT